VVRRTRRSPSKNRARHPIRHTGKLPYSSSIWCSGGAKMADASKICHLFESCESHDTTTSTRACLGRVALVVPRAVHQGAVRIPEAAQTPDLFIVNLSLMASAGIDSTASFAAWPCPEPSPSPTAWPVVLPPKHLPPRLLCAAAPGASSGCYRWRRRLFLATCCVGARATAPVVDGCSAHSWGAPVSTAEQSLVGACGMCGCHRSCGRCSGRLCSSWRG